MYSGKIYIKDFPATLKRTWGYRESGFPFSGIWVFSGQQGSGKTLNAVQCVLDIKKMYPNCRIISNIPLNIDGVEEYKGLSSFEENNGLDGIIYFLDEIQTLYSSMQSKGCSDSSLYIWSQNRKNRRVILGTTQRFSRIAKPIREQTTYIYEMRKVLLNLFSMRIMEGCDINDDGEYIGGRPVKKFVMPSITAYDAYDTRYVVKGGLDKLV